jgi:hypothetical protein
MKNFSFKTSGIIFIVFVTVGTALLLYGVSNVSQPEYGIASTKCADCEPCNNYSPVSSSCNPIGYTERLGAMNGAEMGISVGAAGDVDGDCNMDVIIGERGFDNSDASTSYEGRVLVYYGSSSGINFTAAPDWTIEGNSNNSQFGFSCATAGDINNDGCSDIIIGAYKHKVSYDRPGRVIVFYGDKNRAHNLQSWEMLGEHNGCWFGYSVASAGDVNGDNYDDVIVGAPTFSNEQTWVGKVYVFFGGPNGLTQTVADWVFEGVNAGGQFGISVSAADVNGDQKSDIIVGASHYGGTYNKGRVYCFYGDSNFQCKTSPDWEKSGLNYSEFGHCVANAGDVNSDGYDDIIIGAPNAKINNLLHVGMAYVFYGSITGLNTYENFPWVLEGVEEDEYLGYSVGCAGKINDDSVTQYDDIFVGVPGYRTYNQGGVFLFHGSSSGIIGSYSSHACTINGPRTYSGFGRSGGLAGDINNDGCDDLIFGAPGVDSGGLTDCGYARLIYGYKENGCPYLLPE